MFFVGIRAQVMSLYLADHVHTFFTFFVGKGNGFVNLHLNPWNQIQMESNWENFNAQNIVILGWQHMRNLNRPARLDRAVLTQLVPIAWANSLQENMGKNDEQRVFVGGWYAKLRAIYIYMYIYMQFEYPTIFVMGWVLNGSFFDEQNQVGSKTVDRPRIWMAADPNLHTA